MPIFSQLPNVFAWQHEGEWFYVEDRNMAPGNAVEMWQIHDGTEVFLSVCRGPKGSFIRCAKPLEKISSDQL